MSEKDVLSQEEIDALLHSVDEDVSEETPAAGAKAAVKTDTKEKRTSSGSANPKVVKNEVRLFNFSTQERNVRGELPVLEKIYDRTMRFFSQDIYKLMAKELDIVQEPLLVERHRDFMSSLPNPTLMNIFQFKPLRGKALVYFDSTFVYDLVDIYFGGNSHFSADKDRTDFTATESRVMQLAIQKLTKNIEQAWLPILPLAVLKLGEETNPQLVHITEPNEVILVSRFSVRFGEDSGTFAFVIPYTMVEPIKQLLELGASRPDDEIDPNWVNSLKDELMDVELEISSYMAETTGCLREVLDWKAGDFIGMEQRETVTMDIENTPSFEVETGSAGDKMALQIKSIIQY